MTMSTRWVHGLDWNLLRTFLIIAEEKSVTKAAERLLLQQPTVSAALKRLEETFGTRLFERGQRPMRLTPMGQLLFNQCRDLYLAIANLDPKFSEAANSLTGVVRIAIVTQLVNKGLDDMFRFIHQKYPGISFEIEVSTSHEISRSVSQQIIPFGICLLSKPLSTLDCQPLFRERFAIFCGRDHRLFGVTDVGLHDIRNEPWVSFACAELGNSLEPMLSLKLGAGLSNRIVATSADLHEVRRFIVAGIGIGILPIDSALRDIADGSLWHLPLRKLDELGADVYFLSNPAARHGPAEAVVIEAMQSFGIGESAA